MMFIKYLYNFVFILFIYFVTGTYFHRVILEGGAGDNIRNRPSKGGVFLANTGGIEENTDTSIFDGISTQQRDVVSNDESVVEAVPEVGFDTTLVPPQDGYRLVPPNEIRRILFCCGKVSVLLLNK